MIVITFASLSNDQEQRQKKEAHRANLVVATAANEPNSKEAENGALLTTNIQRHPPESHV